MASLTTETQTEPAEKQCSVCYTDLDLKNTVITPCNHAYCSGCFFKWLSRKETCALCRKPLLSNALVEERTEELQDIQYELMESYRAHRVIKRDLKRKRRQMRNLNDDVQSLMGRQCRLRMLLDKTKIACEETVKRNNAVKQAIKDQREALNMLKDYKKEWEELHTPLVEEKRSATPPTQEEKAPVNDLDIQDLTLTVQELAATERRRAIRDLSIIGRRIGRFGAVQQALAEGEAEEETEEVEEETEEEAEEEAEEEEEEEAERSWASLAEEETEEEEEEAENQEYNTGDEFELRSTTSNGIPSFTTPPRRRILRIPGAPRRRERELPSQSMFVFGANRNSPDTITHSVTSPFEMPTLFNNSTNVPLDFNPHMNLFTPTDSYIPMMELTSSWNTSLGREREAISAFISDMPGNQAMTRLFAEQEQEQGPEPEPSEEISND